MINKYKIGTLLGTDARAEKQFSYYTNDWSLNSTNSKKARKLLVLERIIVQQNYLNRRLLMIPVAGKTNCRVSNF